MKLFKLVKAFIRFAKSVKAEKPERKGPLFGDDPKIYGVFDQIAEERAEKAGTVNREVNTVFPEEGGIKTYIEGEKFPFPGLPSKGTVESIGMLKRMVPAAIDSYYTFFADHVLAPDKYSKPVREVYRLFNIMIERETEPKHHNRWKKVRDMVCVVLEYDNAYRFRMQDLAAEADRKELIFDEGDRYWARRTTTYRWGFLTPEERAKAACSCSRLKDHDPNTCKCQCHQPAPDNARMRFNQETKKWEKKTNQSNK